MFSVLPSVVAHSRRSIAEVIEKHSRPTPPAFDPAALLQQLSDGAIAPVIVVVSLLSLLATGLLVLTLVGMRRRGEEVELEDKPLSPSRAKEPPKDAENRVWLIENWGNI